MANVVDRIREWAKELPYWERAALDKIASGAEITDEDVGELLGYLLDEKGLLELEGPLPELKLDQWTPSDVTEANIRLLSISDLQGINALVPAQKITFGESLTAIYGANGSGKSGYARVLGSVGFTRGDTHILPDVNLAPHECEDQSACIEIRDGDSIRTLRYCKEMKIPELCSIHVFDSTSIIAHITKSHGFSFTPAALACLPKLALVTDRMRALFTERIDECRKTVDFTRRFTGESPVVDFIRALGPKADVKVLERLADISEQDRNNRTALEERKAELVLNNTTKLIVQITSMIDDLTKLADKLKAVADTLADTTTASILNDVADYVRLRSVVNLQGSKQFAVEGLSRIGSEQWHAFVLQAKVLAEAESEDRDPYPRPGDICLLCHQPLNDKAHDLLTRVWIYLKGEAQAALAGAEAKLKEHNETIDGLDVGFFGEQAVSRRHLEARDKALVSSIEAFIESAIARRNVITTALGSIDVSKPAPLSPSPATALNALIQGLESDLTALRTRNTEEELKNVDDQLRLLDHRQILSTNLKEIREYIDGCKWADKASKCSVSTKHITVKHNELFNELVTTNYLKTFEEMLSTLSCPMAVQMVTKSEKSKVFKQITLKVEHVAEGLPSPDKVLSEGEKRAVALADFLTEVAMDEHSCAIVIDDPVTSLDHEWKETIARCLVLESKRRQVIVFTHDLHFLWMLSENAELEKTGINIHYIRRGAEDDRPGYVYLDSCPVLEKEYKKPSIARQFLKEAEEEVEPRKQEFLLKQGFNALRTTYEAFVIHDILRGVVGRWEEQVRIKGCLDKILIDDGIVTTVVTKHGEISRFIEGHSHSDHSTKPSTKKLKEEIEVFEALKKRHGGLLKAAGKN